MNGYGSMGTAAGVDTSTVDRTLGLQLEALGIPIVSIEPYGEVRAAIAGQLGPFRIERRWAYFSVTGGLVPIEVAREMYADQIGRTDVRVCGHCGCPSPDEYGADMIAADGRSVISTVEYEKCLKISFIKPETLAKYVLETDPAAATAERFVDSYHIDSEAGLKVFVETIRKHGLDKNGRKVRNDP